MTTELSHIERVVIALSLNDPAWSLQRQGPFARWLCGRHNVPLPLADPRLEALRRYVILRRVHGHALPESDRDVLCRAGFGLQALATIDALIVRLSGAVGGWPVATTPTPSTNSPHRLAA